MNWKLNLRVNGAAAVLGLAAAGVLGIVSGSYAQSYDSGVGDAQRNEATQQQYPSSGSPLLNDAEDLSPNVTPRPESPGAQGPIRSDQADMDNQAASTGNWRGQGSGSDRGYEAFINFERYGTNAP